MLLVCTWILLEYFWQFKK